MSARATMHPGFCSEHCPQCAREEALAEQAETAVDACRYCGETVDSPDEIDAQYGAAHNACAYGYWTSVEEEAASL